MIDVAVVEAMQRSLAHEPQVANVRRLVPLLAPDGVLLPEPVRIDLVLSDPGVETAGGFASARAQAARVPVGTVFELSRRCAAAPVDAFGPHALATADSGLTVPEVLWQVPDLPAGSRLEFRYRLGRDPGLTWSAPSPR